MRRDGAKCRRREALGAQSGRARANATKPKRSSPRREDLRPRLASPRPRLDSLGQEHHEFDDNGAGDERERDVEDFFEHGSLFSQRVS